ncbi:TIGR02302 family protein [Agrobacterium rosae]|uniref:TIGR02302 family protein n=2 Tax=Pseudomonadota TaxID=1224 RepID=A0ABU4VTL1_9HYPH|nr:MULTISPECIES: TIGR02302 family protein [Agrobacterium]MBN7803935.1 TIGR02302 family protein [Agrobacterium rosae]MCM2431673.1 TIGR02302 family protein [Agrobacterium rosae]MDX8312329.1 TIGR02302 family protein [Agrobacterium rosae]MDX8328661.1 TIGR02302 family protein [Agrobacterium rosae]POO55881.1 TIGR02302 family protein [Agrobacterium rosae]
MTTSKQGGKGAFENRPELARRVTSKRFIAKLVIVAERLAPKTLVPLSIAALFIVLGWFGLYRQMPDILRWAVVFVLIFAFITSLLPILRLKWPTKDEASRLLEERNGLPHQPVGVQEDEPAFETPFARALWKEHQLRMAQRIAALDAGLPQPDIARHDQVALRAVPALILVAAFGFSFSNGAGDIADAFRNRPEAGPANPDIRLDAWVTPPSYTGRAPIFLTGNNAAATDAVSLPQASKLTIRMTGGDGDETVTFEPEVGGDIKTLAPESADKPNGQTVATTEPQATEAPRAPRTFTMEVSESGMVEANGQHWQFNVIPDKAPTIAFENLPRRAVNGALEIGFTAKDDYGIREAHAVIEPVGLAAGATPLYPPPEFKLDLPRQNPRDMKGVTSRNLTEHPMAGKKVRITLVATDGMGQTGRSPSQEMILPGRNFSEPLAASIVEQRQIFSLDTRQMPKAIAFNEAVGMRPDETIPNTTHYLLLQSAQTRMKLAYNEEMLKNTSDYLWEVALGIEDGDLSQAEQRLRDAQKALSEAIDRKAGDEEIAKLMQELREAMKEFMSELAERMKNAPQANMNQQAQNVLRQRDLENMMNQIENLARSGNRDAAQEMLSQMQRMMNNLQAGRPQRGQQGQQQQQNSQLRQQIDKLGEIMQQQQKLMDETFKLDQALRDRTQRGDQPQGEEGGDPQMGENGEQPPGQQGQQQQGQNPTDQMTAEQLREALKNLRQQQDGLGKQLGELQKGLRDLGMEPGQNFGKAEQEMKGAGQALGDSQGEQAVQGQGNALNALRQGAQDMMGQIMQAMRQQGQQPGQGQEGMMGQGGQNGRDPLGRPRESNGPDFGDNQVRVPDEIDVQRAREILEAIREKLGNNPPGEVERRYLERLLDIQ